MLNTTAGYDLESVSLEWHLAWYGDTQASGRPVFVAEVASEVLGWSVLDWSTYGELPGQTGLPP